MKATTIIFLGTLACVGCGRVPRGLIYTDTIQPYCLDLKGLGIGDVVAKGSSKQLQIPGTRVDISAEWDSRAIGDIAKANGIETVLACDLRRESYVLGIWRRDEIIVYGQH